MARRADSEGVSPHRGRIQVRFTWKGEELRPTLDMKPTAANLKHAARIRADILRDIAAGQLDLLHYFPGYKHVGRHQAGPVVHTFSQVRETFVKWVKTRQAHSSVTSLERKLKSFWEPKFGDRDIRAIPYKDLSAHVADRAWGSSKTHNNYVSALREMFAYALDHEYLAENPAAKLKMLKVQRPDPDPYTVQEAQLLIKAARNTHGEVDAIYWEISFLLGMRPGEQISVQWTDWARATTGRLAVRRMRTEGEDKDSTKTSTTRHVDLPPRAVVLLNQLRPMTSLRGPWIFIDHLTGEQIDRSTVMQERWVLLHKVSGVRYREPYQCRHSSVSWKLMMGENFMKVAKNHGHSLATMLKTYAHWIDTDSEAAEVARMIAFHEGADDSLSAPQAHQTPVIPGQVLDMKGKIVASRRGFEPQHQGSQGESEGNGIKHLAPRSSPRIPSFRTKRRTSG